MYSHDRINLLSDAEIEAVYALPVFNEVERALYFEFSDQEIAYAKKYRTVKLQLYFLLSLGYFKAKQRFYATDLIMESAQDAQYIVEKYFNTPQQIITLLSQLEDFVRVETLCNVNDMSSNHIISFPIFRLWNLLDDKLLADAYGQKLATSNSTIQSRGKLWGVTSLL